MVRPETAASIFSLRGLDLAQKAARQSCNPVAQWGQADPGRQPFEQLSAEARLEPSNDAAERRLGDGQPVGRG